MPTLTFDPQTEELYNRLMLQIEPDLLTTEIETLDRKYAGESAAEKKERMARYKRALDIFFDRYGMLMQFEHQQLSNASKDLLAMQIEISK